MTKTIFFLNVCKYNIFKTKKLKQILNLVELIKAYFFNLKNMEAKNALHIPKF